SAAPYSTYVGTSAGFTSTTRNFPSSESKISFLDEATSSKKRIPARDNMASDGSRNRPLHKAITSTISPPCLIFGAEGLSGNRHSCQPSPSRDRKRLESV